MFKQLRARAVIPMAVLATFLVYPLLPNTSASAHAPGVRLSASGTAVVDGVQRPGEWDAAAHVDFLINLPGGGTTPATLFAMNDAARLYLGVRIPGPQIGRGSIAFEFDNDHDGIRENGDNAVVLSADATGTFEGLADTFRFDCFGFPVACSFLDTGVDQNTGRPFGGTSDIAGGVSNDGTATFYEYSIVLNSADDAHDFSLNVGDTVGFALWATFLGPSLPGPCPLCPQPPTPFAHTFFPPSAPNLASEYGDIVIASPDSTPPLISATVAPAPNASVWNDTEVTVTWSVADPDSGIASTSGCGATTITQETGGATLTCSAQNGAGLSATQSVTVKIDKTAPSITFSGNTGTYTVDQTILITCEATDALSGVAITTCPDVASGPATDYVGSMATTSWTLNATATDNAGNTASASTTWTVTVTANGICRLTASLATADDICTKATSIATAPTATAKAGKLGAFDNFLASQSGKSIPADLATLLSRLAHLL